MSAVSRLRELHQYDEVTEECKTCHVRWLCDVSNVLASLEEIKNERDNHECEEVEEHNCKEQEYYDALDAIDDIVAEIVER